MEVFNLIEMNFVTNCLFRDADVVIGDNTHQSVLSVTDFSMLIPYFFHDDTTWCVRQAEPIPAWMNFFYIVPPTVMVAGFVSLSAVVFFTYMFSSFEDHPPDIWSTIIINFQAVVLLPSQFNPKRLILRFFFGSALLAIIAATTTFMAFYYDFMLQPRYYKQIDSFDQLVTHKFLLAGEKHTKDYLLEQNTVNKELFDCDQAPPMFISNVNVNNML